MTVRKGFVHYTLFKYLQYGDCHQLYIIHIFTVWRFNHQLNIIHIFTVMRLSHQPYIIHIFTLWRLSSTIHYLHIYSMEIHSSTMHYSHTHSMETHFLSNVHLSHQQFSSCHWAKQFLLGTWCMGWQYYIEYVAYN